MENLKKLMIGCALFVGLEQVTHTREENSQGHQHHQNSQGHQHHQNNQGHQHHQNNQRRGGQSQHEGSRRGGNQSQHQSGKPKKTVHIGSQVIQRFLDAVRKIPKENTEQKKPKSEKPQTKDSRGNTKAIVNKAADAYKKLYEQAKKPNTTVTESENRKIQGAVRKLFNAVNIPNAVWGDVVHTRSDEGGQGSHQSGQKK